MKKYSRKVTWKISDHGIRRSLSCESRGFIREFLLPTFNLLDKSVELCGRVRHAVQASTGGNLDKFLGFLQEKPLPARRLGHPRLCPTTDVFCCLSEEGRLYFPDRYRFL